MKIVNKYTMKVFDDGSVKHEFDGIEGLGLGVGRFERLLNKAFPALRQAHAAAGKIQRTLAAKKAKELEDKRVADAAVAHSRRALASAILNGSVEVTTIPNPDDVTSSLKPTIGDTNDEV